MWPPFPDPLFLLTRSRGGGGLTSLSPPGGHRTTWCWGAVSWTEPKRKEGKLPLPCFDSACDPGPVTSPLGLHRPLSEQGVDLNGPRWVLGSVPVWSWGSGIEGILFGPLTSKPSLTGPLTPPAASTCPVATFQVVWLGLRQHRPWDVTAPSESMSTAPALGFFPNSQREQLSEALSFLLQHLVPKCPSPTTRFVETSPHWAGFIPEPWKACFHVDSLRLPHTLCSCCGSGPGQVGGTRGTQLGLFREALLFCWADGPTGRWPSIRPSDKCHMGGQPRALWGPRRRL